MTLKPGQKACITTLDSALVVAAGAGSGKTFTLTKRIVYAITSGAIDDINEVLAITFTTKAAAELKSRIKSALREAGRMDQALKVDNAWVSTIHSMCSRILHAHALELGINPLFEIATDTQTESFMNDSLEEVLRQAPVLFGAEKLDALFAEYGVRARGLSYDTSIAGLLRVLIEAAQKSPEGVDSLVMPAPSVSPYRLVVGMVEVAQDIAAHAAQEKASKSRDTFIEKTEQALEACRALLIHTDLSALGALNALNMFPVPPKNFGGDSYRDHAREAGVFYGNTMLEAILGAARPHLDLLKAMTQAVYAAYARRKHEAGVLDNNDLLSFTLQAFQNISSLARDYEHRFKLVMIDEFQDTDQVQIDIISYMTGKNFERLCTVGDAQQSIYRFRGADVSIYRHHLETVRQQNVRNIILLPDNFRSHADVLAFVDRVFEQPHVFGKTFMSLAPSRDESRVKQTFADDETRIYLQLFTHPRSGGPSSRDARLAAAQGIAKRFAAFRDAGHKPAEMVLLLGKTTHAGVYAQALRDEGFACVIAKGSVFGKALESNLMVSLARYVANTGDTQALFEILSSPMFMLTPDDFLTLTTTVNDEGVARKRSLRSGIYACAQRDLAALSPQLRVAVQSLTKLYAMIERVSVAGIMRMVISDSGLLSRLQAQGAEGLAQAGNIYKALRMVEDIEQKEALGPAGVAERFACAFSSAKTAPGALSTKGGDFVRIMTIHSSKGLEFPLVAVAELPSDKRESSALCTTQLQGKTYLSLTLKETLSACCSASLVSKCSSLAREDRTYDNCTDEELIDAICAPQSASAARLALIDHEFFENAQEAKRLLYVALTRAKEALVISLYGPSGKTNPSGITQGVAADIQSALCGAGGIFETGCTCFDFKGAHPAFFERIDLAEVIEDAPEGEKEGFSQAFLEEKEAPHSLDIYEIAPFTPEQSVPYKPDRQSVFSYSSLAAGAPRHDLPLASVGAESEEACGEKEAALTHESLQPDSIFEQEESGGITPSRKNLSDFDKATDLGSAFHRLAQYAIKRRGAAGGLEMPPLERINILSTVYHLDTFQRNRLEEAGRRWFASSLAQGLAAYDSLEAEVPFFLPLSVHGIPCNLEGEIDCLATNGGKDNALVVDYKTGGQQGESSESLQAKHALQATCYAYAVLRQGYTAVDVVFVRVEQPITFAEHAFKSIPTFIKTRAGGDSDLQYVFYRFIATDLGELERIIGEAYGMINDKILITFRERT